MAVLRRTAETTRSLPLRDAAKRTLSMVAASGTGCKTAAAARRVFRRPHPAVRRFHGGVLFHNAQEFPESPRADLAKWRLAECLLHRAAAPLRNELWDVQEGGTRRAILDIYASSDADPSEPVWAWARLRTGELIIHNEQIEQPAAACQAVADALTERTHGPDQAH